MKIYNTPRFPAEFRSKVGSSFVMFAFTGIAPASLDDLAFNPYNTQELISNSASAIAISVNTAGDLLSGENMYCLKYPEGHTLDVDLGMYRISPKTATFSDGLSSKNDFFGTMRLLTYQIGSGSTISRSPADEYTEYDFGREVTLDHIIVSHSTNTSYSIDEYAVSYFDEGEWKVGEDIKIVRNSISSGVADMPLSKAYTCSKLRIIFKEMTASNTEFGGAEFFSKEEPTIGQVLAEDYTWFLMIPTTAPVDSTKVPLMKGAAGGPNSGKEVAFNKYKSDPASEVKLLNFKFGSTPMEAI